MKKITFLSFISIICLVFYNSHVIAQPGSLDPTFDPGTGANNTVVTTAVQNDGKILIGGSFNFYNGINYNRVVRLNTDGSIDTTFDPGTGGDGQLWNITIQPDGKILITGNFSEYNGIPRNRIARLNPDGSLDNTFDPGQGATGSVITTAIQSDGKIIIGGFFTHFDGFLRNGIARLNQNGSLDNSFNSGTGIGDQKILYSADIQSDGKILIAGNFISYNGTPRKNITRLNPDGSLDTTFDTGTGPDMPVYKVIIENGKIIIGGRFTEYNGNTRNGIARLNTDGSLDHTFDPGSGVDQDVTSMVKQSDGKLIIVGHFTTYNGTAINRIARLNQDGSLDTTFNTGTGANDLIWSVSSQNDDKVVIGGWFTNYNGTLINRIARINSETLSIDDWVNNLKNQVKIYPNPANDLVTISNIPDGSSLGILDMTGKLIHSLKNIDDNSSVNTSNLVNGIYILKIENNGSVAHKKLVVKR